MTTSPKIRRSLAASQPTGEADAYSLQRILPAPPHQPSAFLQARHAGPCARDVPCRNPCVDSQESAARWRAEREAAADAECRA